MSSIDYSQKIPNNVNLAERPRAAARARALAAEFPVWWHDMGPEGVAGARRLPANRDSASIRRAGRNSTT